MQGDRIQDSCQCNYGRWKIETDYKLITSKQIDHLKEIQIKMEQHEKYQRPWQQLTKIIYNIQQGSFFTIRQIQGKLYLMANVGKIEFNIRNRQDIRYLLNIDKLMATKQTLEMSLMTLNKVATKIPTDKKLRPICVLQHFTQLIELFYAYNLQRKMRYEIGEYMFGLVPKLGTQTHRMNDKFMTFIDLLNAYNMVDRAKLKEGGWINMQKGFQ